MVWTHYTKSFIYKLLMSTILAYLFSIFSWHFAQILTISSGAMNAHCCLYVQMQMKNYGQNVWKYTKCIDLNCSPLVTDMKQKWTIEIGEKKTKTKTKIKTNNSTVNAKCTTSTHTKFVCEKFKWQMSGARKLTYGHRAEHRWRHFVSNNNNSNGEQIDLGGNTWADVVGRWLQMHR